MFKQKEKTFCVFLLVLALSFNGFYCTSLEYDLYDTTASTRRKQEKPRALSDNKDPSCTIDKPYRWSTDRHCHKNALVADEGCGEAGKPQKCGDGKCYKSHAECNFILNKCADLEKPYSCFTGVCTKSIQECFTLAKEQNIIQKCSHPKHQRCEDGYCRADCNRVKSSRCPQSKPWNCGFGACKSQEGSCTAESYCDFNRPFMCPDMSCMGQLSDCVYSYAFGVFDSNIMFTYENAGRKKPSSFKYFGETELQDFGKFLFNVEATGKTFQPHEIFSPYQVFNKERSTFEASILDSDAYLFVNSVPRNAIDDVKTVYNQTHYSQIQEYFNISPAKMSDGLYNYTVESHISVKSAVIEVMTLGRNNDEEIFGAPITVVFKVDKPQQYNKKLRYWHYERELCQGKIDPIDKEWNCVSRDQPEQPGLESQENKEYIIKYGKMSYLIHSPGTYAVLQSPIYAPPFQKPMAFIGWQNHSKFLFVIIVFLIIPLTQLLLKFIWKMVEFDEECLNIKEDKMFMKEQLNQLYDITCDFVGQDMNEKVTAEYDFLINPIHHSQGCNVPETKEINLEFERIAKEKEDAEKLREKQRVGLINKQEKIRDLRDKLTNYKNEKWYAEIGININLLKALNSLIPSE